MTNSGHPVSSCFSSCCQADFGDDLQNFTLEKRSRNYTRYLRFDSLKNQGAFGLLTSYGSDQNSGELAPKPPRDFTWYRCLKHVRELLQRNSDADFDFLVIYADQQVGIHETLDFYQKTSLFSFKAAREVHHISKLLVILIVAKEWNLDPEDVQKLTELLTLQCAHHFPPDERTNALPKTKFVELISPPYERTKVLRKGKLWKANLPSSRPRNGPWMTTQDVFTFEYPTEKTIASFQSDLSVYIFRPSNSRKLLMIVPNRQAFGKWPKAKTWHGEVMEIAKSAMKLPETSMHDFHLKLTKTQEFKGRKRPSGSKLQHLLHIEDCIRTAVPTCQTNTETIKRLLKYLDENLETSLTETYAEHRRDIGSLSNDLDYFAGKLDSLAEDLQRIHRTTREQLDLVQLRRTTVLTFLAGL
ncbi:hypothetical protein IWX90DRAFT_416112 [Phyllosticta citrichinensis]|uniref:Uncharacterized protein n=1 Tax=Phyllosticta citrichinensis TaxID=1130410 RepID=A0ABR1XS19_9PEZI